MDVEQWKPPVTEPSPQPVQCPQCGEQSMVSVTRRDAEAFCPRCDYPLFWAPTSVAAQQSTDGADESLRRLPGAAGRVTVASQPCPHCAEPNPLSAQVCLRCGLSMRIEAPPQPAPAPAPPPVVVAQPEPEPVARQPIWPWILAGLLVCLVIVLVVWLVARH